VEAKPRSLDGLFKQVEVLVGLRHLNGALRIGGDDDHRHRHLQLAQRPFEFEPAHPRHVEVGNDDIEPLGMVREKARRG